MTAKTHSNLPVSASPSSPEGFENQLFHTLSYFALFSYPPSAEELFLYHKTKMSKSDFSRLLIRLLKTGRVIERTIDTKRYVKKGLENFFDLYKSKRQCSQDKLKILKKYIAFLKGFSSLQYVGISGSLASMNAEQADDIDLFIITEHSRLWTGRMIAGIVALLMGVKRTRGTTHQENTICLNLFFDANELCVPPMKQTEYVAHEILQLVPVLNRHSMEKTFLNANAWVLTIFPNATIPFHTGHRQRKSFSFLTKILEQVCKTIQLVYMKPARTKERITPYQLWFFPHDYENRVKKYMK